jgi:hypothetical protein
VSIVWNCNQESLTIIKEMRVQRSCKRTRSEQIGYTLYPMDALNRMTWKGTEYLQGLTGKSSHVVHGSNERRTQDIDSSRLFDWSCRVSSRARIKSTILHFGRWNINVRIDSVNIGDVVSDTNMPCFW